MGYVELKVSDLAQPSEGEHPFSSIGKKDFTDGAPVKLDKGTFKGKLHFVAEFVPALPLKNVKFDSSSNELKRVVDDTVPEGDGDTVRSDGESMFERDEEPMPITVTVIEPLDENERPVEHETQGHKKTGSNGTIETSLTLDSVVSAKSRTTANTSLEEKHPEEPGLELSREELLRYRAYLILCCYEC